MSAMKLIAQVKLQPTKEQIDQLERTMRRVNEACNLVSNMAWEHKVFRRVDLQKLTYAEVRSRFGLSAQIAIHAVYKVADAYRKDKATKREFKPMGAISYDERILTWRSSDSTVSIWTLDGRQRMPFACGDRQRKLLESLDGQADLVYRNGEFYLHQVCDVDDPAENDPDGWLGVDLGIVNIATTSDGQNFSGKDIERTRQWHDERKAKLQRVGTLNSKRRLRQLSGRQRRFQKDTNHKISKQIVETARDTGCGIALEDLGGIRERVTVRKQQRARHNNWSFHQLKTFLVYKAKMIGVPVRLVDPRNTSKTCSVCGHCDQGNRPTRDDFLCLRCGYAAPADANGAANIAARASVITPIVSDAPALLV
jgi:IS605 OrfB family transposase